ncbi:hypothetical protein K504DRAFT_460464 [Pleomassaria siparia CBS 279.74]|uniref:Uncharacterized protein n=1 Tax=Pleomassaria siparia CBS 279.74 TaxID=1314801 RepID=A0A6G1JXC6_9PLEO|nr:hypothetical protein K504DRAFT_460464 [Pleomassaria siparia CBS 279.74]
MDESNIVSFTTPILVSGTPIRRIRSNSPPPRPNQRGQQQPFFNKPFSSPSKRKTRVPNKDDDWMGNQALQRNTGAHRRKNMAKNRGPPLLSSKGTSSGPQSLIPDPAERRVDNSSGRYSENNTGVRDLFEANRDRGALLQQHRSSSPGTLAGSLPWYTPRRSRSTNVLHQNPSLTDRASSPESRDIFTQLRTYADTNRVVAPAASDNVEENDAHASTTTVAGIQNGNKHTCKARPTRRRRSTLPSLRSKSSLLPLNNTPRPYRTQDVILTLSLPLPLTRPSSPINLLRRKLNMSPGVNSLAWGYPVPTADDDDDDDDHEGNPSAFDVRTEEARVQAWCEIIARYFNPNISGGNTTSLTITDGIWRALSDRAKNQATIDKHDTQYAFEHGGDSPGVRDVEAVHSHSHDASRGKNTYTHSETTMHIADPQTGDVQPDDDDTDTSARTNDVAYPEAKKKKKSTESGKEGPVVVIDDDDYDDDDDEMLFTF